MGAFRDDAEVEVGPQPVFGQGRDQGLELVGGHRLELNRHQLGATKRHQHVHAARGPGLRRNEPDLFGLEHLVLALFAFVRPALEFVKVAA